MRIFRNKVALFGLAIMLPVALFSIFAPVFVSSGANEVDWESMYLAPSFKHPFGTDGMGRDLFARVAYGTKISFAVGILATLVSIVIGVTWGLVAGYLGGKTDYLMMRVVDIIYSLPFMFFVIIMIVFLGRNIFNLFVALGAVQWLTMSRIVRSEVLSVKKRDFVEAARSMGVTKSEIIFKHILPNVLNTVLSYGFLLIPVVMIEESFLSFLGLGVQPPNASLGTLINDGIATMDIHWWLLFIPAGFLVILLFGLNFFGEGLRDTLNPAYKGTKAR